MIYGLIVDDTITKISSLFKPTPDDVIIVIGGIFLSVLYMVGNINSMYSKDQFWWLFGPVISFIMIPFFYSAYVQYKEKKYLKGG